MDAKGTAPSTTFTPPTGKMGYGNVYTSLALAKQNLGERRHYESDIGATKPHWLGAQLPCQMVKRRP
jgi:hypothetical protein